MQSYDLVKVVMNIHIWKIVNEKQILLCFFRNRSLPCCWSSSFSCYILTVICINYLHLTWDTHAFFISVYFQLILIGRHCFILPFILATIISFFISFAISLLHFAFRAMSELVVPSLTATCIFLLSYYFMLFLFRDKFISLEFSVKH